MKTVRHLLIAITIIAIIFLAFSAGDFWTFIKFSIAIILACCIVLGPMTPWTGD